MLDYARLWYIIVYYGILWYTMVYYGILWYIMCGHMRRPVIMCGHVRGIMCGNLCSNCHYVRIMCGIKMNEFDYVRPTVIMCGLCAGGGADPVHIIKCRVSFDSKGFPSIVRGSLMK